MENIGVSFPTLLAPENDVISIVIQAVIFIVIGIMAIYLIRVYFKNMELKKDFEKNSSEIHENMEKIEKIKKWFIKIAGIIFAVVIMATIIMSNFM